MQSWIVTGANRGIGLEYVRQLLAAGDTVIATARDPQGATALQALAGEYGETLRIEALDTGDGASIAAFAERIAGVPVDVLLNNAGLYGGSWDNGSHRQSFEQMDYDLWEEIMRVNVMGPYRLTGALRGNLALGTRKLVVMMSSDLGSIANNQQGQSYAYRSSKAALNMVTKGFSLDLAPEGITAIAMAPGWTQTDLGGSNARWPVSESVSQQLGVIAGIGAADTGSFVDLLGAAVPW